MNITYLDPFSRGWRRMTNALFRPFDIKKWFIVGFTAFLAGLLDGGGSGGGPKSNWRNNIDWEDISGLPFLIREWILDHFELFSLIIFGIILLIAIIVVLTWISSRGKFMFLDNVIHNRALVKKPWYQFRNEGNSLFIWRLVFGFVVFAIILLYLFIFFMTVVNFSSADFEPAKHVPSIVGFLFLFVMTIITVAYISLFLDHFIVPIMYKNNISATQAWSIFLKIFSQHWIHFILYGILILLMYIVIIIMVIFIGLFTCCLGFILLIIPYISSVVTLPISYTFRAFSVEFLEQFGPEFEIFPRPEDEEEALLENQ